MHKGSLKKAFLAAGDRCDGHVGSTAGPIPREKAVLLGTFSSHTCQAWLLRKEMTCFSEGLLEKVTALKTACFISKTTESTVFFIFFCSSHLFPHFSIFSVWIPPRPPGKWKRCFEWEAAGKCLGEAPQGRLAPFWVGTDTHSL